MPAAKQSYLNGNDLPRYSSVGDDVFNRRKLKKRHVIVTLVLTILAAGVTAVVTWQIASSRSQGPPLSKVPPNPEEPLPPSPSVLHVFNKAAVCTDGTPCSKVGRDILSKNGSAVDAALAAMFCNGVVNMQSMGLGGGFIMTIYDRQEQKAYSLIARESAPGNATRDMFANNTSLSQDGALASGVPGELRGYWEVWKRFGKLPWAEILEPTLQICKDGYHMNKHQSDALEIRTPLIHTDANFREIFVDPYTGKMKPTGSLIRPKKLCQTLEIIAKEGGDAVHNGSLTKPFVEDIREMGGIITEEDLNNYRPVWRDPITVQLQGDTLYTSPPPGSGALLAFILNILDGYNMTEDSIRNLNNTTLTFHRLVEAFKFAYAKRTELGDPDFVDVTEVLKDLTSEEYATTIRAKILDNTTFNSADHYGGIYYNKEDHGTAHMSILAANGDAVSVTSTVNLYFGGGVSSKQTGIVLNSGMDDFSVPDLINYYGLRPSPRNFIEPGKRSMSSKSPTIIVSKEGDVKMVIGASGGTKITTAVAGVIMRYMWLGQTIKEAVDASRIHHQLFPMAIDYEYGIVDQLIKNFEKLGHKTSRYKDRGSIICALATKNNKIFANADYRKGGEVYGID